MGVMMLNDAVQMGCPQVELKLLDQKVLQSLPVSYISTLLYGFICSKAASSEGRGTNPGESSEDLMSYVTSPAPHIL